MRNVEYGERRFRDEAEQFSGDPGVRVLLESPNEFHKLATLEHNDKQSLPKGRISFPVLISLLAASFLRYAPVVFTNKKRARLKPDSPNANITATTSAFSLGLVLRGITLRGITTVGAIG